MKFNIIIFITVLFFSPFVFACESEFSAIVIDDENGEILYEQRADKIIYPASLAKMMTLYLAFEELESGKKKLTQKIKVSANAQDVAKVNKVNTSKLKEGEIITFEEAINASIVKSFNETSICLAETISGDEWQFVKMMNDKAHQLKMFHTNFRNSTGLHEDGQYTTTYDLARLLMAIQKKFPQYKNYFTQKDFKLRDQKYDSHNRFLLEYKGAKGFKTGFTAKSGFSLMAGAKRKEGQVSAIVAGCETSLKRDEFMKKIIDEAFKYKNNVKEKEVRVFLRR